MRYILRRDTFLQKDKINEVFKNELTWGGSLFGRLINSSLRVLKINYDTVRIKDVLKNIEATIYEILKESLDKDLRVKLYRYRIKNKVTQIRNISLDRSLDFYKNSTDCGSGPVADTKLSKLIGFDEPDTLTPEFNQQFKDLTSGLLDEFFQEIDLLTNASRGTGNQDLKNVLTRQELDDLRNIHSDYSVELRKIRWSKCNGVSLPDRINRRSKWKGKEVIMNTDQNLKDEIAVKNESRIFRKFSEFEIKRKSILEYADTTKEYGSLLSDINKKGVQSRSDSMTLVRPKELVPELRTDTISNLDNIINMMENIMSFLGTYKPSDPNLSNLVSNGITSKIFAKWSSNKNWIKNLFISDSKSLRIFLSTFITSLYGIRFGGGEDLYEKIRDMKLNETLATKSQLQEIYLQRREFISDLPTFIRYFQSILSFLIELKKSNKFVEGEHNQIYQLLKKFFSFLYNNKTQLMSGLVEGPKLAGSGIEDVPGPVKSNQQDTDVVDTNKDKEEDTSTDKSNLEEVDGPVKNVVDNEGDNSEDNGGSKDRKNDSGDDNKDIEDDGGNKDGKNYSVDDGGDGADDKKKPIDEVEELYDELFIQRAKKENFEYRSKNYLLIKEAFDITRFELTRDDIKEFQELETKLSRGEFSLTRDRASDAIIRLLNLLTTAYELFAVDFIPSGRPGGRVSMKTFKEYQKLGTGSSSTTAQQTPSDAGGTAIIPGYGPWAQRQTYKEFQNFVDKLLEDQELRKIFSNVNFNYPGSEDKFNDSYRYDILTEDNKQNSIPQIRKKNMGPEIFNLLQTLRTPSTCGDGLVHIDKVKRVYFGLEPTPVSPTPSNVPGGSDGGTSLQKKLEFRQESLSKSDDLKKRNTCLSINQDASLDKNNIKDSTNPTLVDYPTRPSTLIFLTYLQGINSIKTTYGAIIEFIPVKITFKTPAVANQINDKGSYRSYCDLTEISTPEPKIYYGYVYLQNDKMCLFYVNTTSEPITQIDFQKVKIEEKNIPDRRNPEGKSPAVPGDQLFKTGVLIDGSRIISPYTDSIDYFSSDRDNYQIFFEREISLSTGDEKFKDYMKKILEDKSENHNRLEEISK